MVQDKAKQSMRPGASNESAVKEGAFKDSKRARPEWADGLRQLYDSVVNEPLPDSFADLLSKLDNDGQ